jgi:hypothetical protein
MRGDAGRNARPAIADADFHIPCACAAAAHQNLTVLVRHVGQRLDGVAHQVEQQLLDLRAVDPDLRQVETRLEAIAHPVVLGVGLDEIGQLGDQGIDSSQLTGTLLGTREAAQATNDFSSAQRLRCDLLKRVANLPDVRIGKAQQPIASLCVVGHRAQWLIELVGDAIAHFANGREA